MEKIQKDARSYCASWRSRNSKVAKGWPVPAAHLSASVAKTKWIMDYDRVWLTRLDGLESGRVIVGVLLEDVPGSETKGAQAVQDGGLEAWAKRILKCAVWNINEVKTHHLTWIPRREQNEQREIWRETEARVRWWLTSYRSKAGVDVERVPVSAQAVQGRLEPITGETGIVHIYDSLIVSKLFFFFSYTQT